jgi:hypothetical protein
MAQKNPPGPERPIFQNVRVNPRTLTAPAVAFTMAVVVLFATRSIIQSTQAEARMRREQDLANSRAQKTTSA